MRDAIERLRLERRIAYCVFAFLALLALLAQWFASEKASPDPRACPVAHCEMCP